MADSSFLQSNKDLKLRDLGDGTYAQSIQVENTVSVTTIEEISNVSSVDAVDTVTTVEEIVKVTTLLDGTVSVTKETIASAPSHNTYAVTSVSTTISSTSNTRKYLCIANNTDTDIWIALGTVSVVEKGIPLFADGSAYEMSSEFGNLFRGDVTAILSGTVSKTIQVVEG